MAGAGVGVEHGEVVGAEPGNFQAEIGQCFADTGAVADVAGEHALQQVVGDQLLGIGLDLDRRPHGGGVEQGAMAGGLRTRTRRIVRRGPALRMVPGIAQRVIRPFPARRRRVVREAGLQIDTCRKNVDMAAAVGVTMQHRGVRQPVDIQAGRHRALEVIQHRVDLGVAGLVFPGPGDDPAAVAPDEGEGITQGGHQRGIAAQHADLSASLAAGIAFAEQIVNRIGDATATVREPLRQHRSASCSGSDPGATATVVISVSSWMRMR